MKKSKLLSILCIAGLAFNLISCDDSFIYDNRDNCHSGINIRLVYDHHMEPLANAFPSNVDCVTIFVLDTLGNYLTQFNETSSLLLRDENYRMHLPLEEGKYRLLIYGGLTCDHHTFNFSPDWLTKATNGTRDDIRVSLPLNNGVSNAKLHDLEERWGGLFYGVHDIEIGEADWTDNHRTETVYLMKNTNNIQVVLQELAEPDKMDVNDYEFKIIDDNFVLDGYNRAVSIATDNYQPYYSPYATETRTTGYVEPGDRTGQEATTDNTRPVKVACAEFSTSRLFFEHAGTAHLIVTAKNIKDDNGNNKVIIDIPLITYLSITRGFGQNWIKPDGEFNHYITGYDNVDQQFLDRRSDWTLMFFLQRNEWIKARVIVNDWTVRVNDIQL